MADEIIQGLNNLKAAFDQLPLNIRQKMLVSSTKKAGSLIQALAQYKAPVRTGKGVKGIIMRVDESSPTSVTVDIGPSTDAWYMRLVEYGTKPHDIRMPDGGVIHHPGAKPEPFLRPAWDEGQEEALAILQDDLAYKLGNYKP